MNLDRSHDGAVLPSSAPRVAFFADSFYEVNGVAKTSREFARFARERQIPFFSVHAGPETRHSIEGSFETYELRNSRLRVRLETDLSFDVLFLRHFNRLTRALARFQPDLVHITGPSHIGILGALAAFRLGVPLVASWHTNLHEYAARRLNTLLRWLPLHIRLVPVRLAERASLSIVLSFFRLARVLFAPNPELVDLLSARTGRPTFPMQRGIDTALFSPARRDRTDSDFTIGFVGRLSSEKNVRALAQLERILIEQGASNCKFLIVGDGAERPWLAAHLQRRDLPGVLLGEELARAYANMDVFVFPSATDTFGNVVLEAMASGVPAIVSSCGGPKFLVDSGVTGFISQNPAECAHYVLALRDDLALRQHMSQNARAAASAFSWSAVFEGVYRAYEQELASSAARAAAAQSPDRQKGARAASAFAANTPKP